MAGLSIAVDLRGLAGPGERPAGPSRWARRLAALMVEQAGEHEVRLVERGTPPSVADVVVGLGTSPLPGGALPTVSAVCDLSHLLAPRSHTLLERTRRGWESALRTRRSDALLAPSQSIARALVTYLRVPDDRVTWIPTIGPGWHRSPRAEVEALCAELGLRERYLVFVGAVSQRKNLSTLMRAWDRLWPELGERADLVVVGAAPSRQAVADVVAGGARYLGPLPDERLLPLLTGACAWVNPSLAEGCSMGAVEAMATGTPVLVSEGTAAAEVIGNAGVVLPALDAGAWAAAVRRVLEDTAWRNAMAARGLRAAAELREADAGRRALAAAAAAAGRRTRAAAAAAPGT